MVSHADQRDLLEDTMYRSLCTLRDGFSDEHATFDEHHSDAPFCAHKVCEAPLEAYTLAHPQSFWQLGPSRSVHQNH
jgi:hypothetical protein